MQSMEDLNTLTVEEQIAYAIEISRITMEQEKRKHKPIPTEKQLADRKRDGREGQRKMIEGYVLRIMESLELLKKKERDVLDEIDRLYNCDFLNSSTRQCLELLEKRKSDMNNEAERKERELACYLEEINKLEEKGYQTIQWNEDEEFARAIAESLKDEEKRKNILN